MKESSRGEASALFDLFGALDRRYPWRHDALCRNMGQEAWFAPGNGAEARKARKICEQCPVRIECHDYAFESEQVGIWGGILLDRPR